MIQIAKVTPLAPNIVSLRFEQERGDPDYGSCQWAIFNLDLDRYDLFITSDCGNYSYRWIPTPSNESFMHLMSRIESGYLLDKLASPCVIDSEKTFAEVKALMDAYGADLSEEDIDNEPIFNLKSIEHCCQCDNTKDVYESLMTAFHGTPLENVDPYDVYSCIQHDYTANAKKIVEVFAEYIQPICKVRSATEEDK